MDDRMGIGSTKEQQLGTVLGLIADELDIPESLRKEMVRKYNHLGEWIRQDNEERYRTESEIYTQGSVRLGTVIKPISDDCGYDVDLVYLRKLGENSISQEQLVEQAGEQLERYIAYRRGEGKDVPTLERRRRCWAMNYDDRFHMDVLPSIPDEEGSLFSNRSVDTSILLTDRDLLHWQHSNPKAYAEWFRGQETLFFELKEASMAREGKVEIESITDDGIKTPLRIAIQILKRHRDIRYNGDPDDKPISIIITTLAAATYQNEMDVVTALQGIIDRMPQKIAKENGTWLIPNPVNPKENFADKWNDYPKRAEVFFEWLRSVDADMKTFLSQSGIHNVAINLSESFGSDIVETSIKKYGVDMDQTQQRGELKMAAGTGLLGTAVGTTIPRNTWYGDK